MRCGDEAYSYDAFGNQTSETEDTNPFRYSGEYYDEETGLIYLRARYYDSGVGAFASADTHWNVGNMIYGDDNTGIPSIAAIMQSGNLYVYCMGNPVNLLDSFGTDAFDKFSTKEEALKDWAWNYYGITDYVLIEVGSILYTGYDENGNLYYSYTWGVVGDFHNVDPLAALPWVPEGTNAVGMIHSHPNEEDISYPDKEVAENSNLDNYVVTPSGKILRYGLNRQDTKWVVSVAVSYAPVAPLSGARKAELRGKFQNMWYQHQLNGCAWNCQYITWPRG